MELLGPKKRLALILRILKNPSDMSYVDYRHAMKIRPEQQHLR